MATIQIETLLPWSEAKKVETRNGPRNLRTASPTQAFWSAWKNGKETLKAAGVSVGKGRSGEWEACWWTQLDGAAKASIEAAQEASRATDSNRILPCPDGLEYLPYQKAGIAYAMDRNNVLFGDEMGLGKTIQAIGVFNADESIKKVLVICPATLRLNWRREIEKWFVGHAQVNIVSGGKQWPESRIHKAGTRNLLVYVVNYDVLAKHRKMIDSIEWDLLIVDECHYLKNPKAQRTNAVLGKVTRGKRAAEAISARRKLFLTGTPIVNRPVELWPLIEALDPADLGKNFFGYAKRYCDAKQTKWGWDFTGASRLDELQRKLREKFMVRRLKADVLTELPAKRRQIIEIPANGANEAVKNERQIFEKHEAYIEELEARLREAEIENAYAIRDELYTFGEERINEMRRNIAKAKSIAFTEMSKARHETALAKVPHVIAHLTDALEAGPVVCFAHHRDVIAQIKDAFPQAVTLTGDTPMTERQEAVDAFQAGRSNLFIGNIQAAGVGITLTKSSHVVFAELDWVPGNLSQAEDRCHRIGQTASVLVQHIVLEDSVDAIMAKKIVAKQEVIAKALDTQAEVDWGTKGSDEVEIEIKPDRVAVETKKLEEKASINPELIPLIHTGLRMIAGMCDGAVALDDRGFNKYDSNFGKSLASQPTLTARQAVLAKKLVTKYRRQLPAELVEKINA